MTAVATITIVPAAPEHGDGIARIVAAQRLPLTWRWPKDEHGAVALLDGRVVAFCALRTEWYGIVVDELWPEPTRDGLEGMSLLGEWAEGVAADLANRRGEPVLLGGVVLDSNEPHRRMLERRGYTAIATVLHKAFAPRKEGE